MDRTTKKIAWTIVAALFWLAPIVSHPSATMALFVGALFGATVMLIWDN